VTEAPAVFIADSRKKNPRRAGPERQPVEFRRCHKAAQSLSPRGNLAKAHELSSRVNVTANEHEVAGALIREFAMKTPLLICSLPRLLSALVAV
jgi:hypothetical protein